VNNKLRQLGRAPVRVAAVPEKKFGQVAELRHGKIRREGGLLALFSDDATPAGGNGMGMRAVSMPSNN